MTLENTIANINQQLANIQERLLAIERLARPSSTEMVVKKSIEESEGEETFVGENLEKFFPTVASSLIGYLANLKSNSAAAVVQLQGMGIKNTDLIHALNSAFGKRFIPKEKWDNFEQMFDQTKSEEMGQALLKAINTYGKVRKQKKKNTKKKPFRKAGNYQNQN